MGGVPVTDPEFDLYDVRHAVASGFNAIALLKSPAAMRRTLTKMTKSELHALLGAVLGDVVRILKSHPANGVPAIDALLEVFTTAHAAFESRPGDGAPSDDVVERASEWLHQLEQIRHSGDWRDQQRLC